jgi:hypothetical protein
MEFYAKVSEDQDYIINFNLKKDYDLSVFDIKAYVVSEDIIEKLKLDNTYVYNSDALKGKYEISFSMAKLVINKEYIKQHYTKDKKNYIYLIIESSNNNPTILNNVFGEITVLQNNNIDYIAPNNIYINSNLEKGISSKYKLIKKNSDDKIMRIEFSYSSENVKYKLDYADTTPNNLLSEPTINYEEKNTLGKKNIDINLDNEHDTLIFEIYSDKTDIDVSELSYSLRYRTDKENNFKNYKTKGNINLVKKETDKVNNKTNITLSIPAIKDNSTSEIISAQYYLKVYNYTSKNILINNTISLVDNLEPYKVIEFTNKNEDYEQKLELPNNNEKYFILVDAITDDRELLSYNSIIVDIEKGKDDGGKSDDVQPEKSGGLPVWALVLIIILSVLLLIAIAFIIVRCIMKKRGNVVEDDNKKMIPLTE